MSENVSVNVVPQYHLEYSIRDIDSLQAAINAPYESIELWHDQINSYKKYRIHPYWYRTKTRSYFNILEPIYASRTRERTIRYGTVPYHTIHRKSEKY